MAGIISAVNQQDPNSQADLDITITTVPASFLLKSTSNRLLASEIHVWQFPLEAPEPAFSALSNLLNEDERARAARFRFEKHARHFSVSRGSVRSILAGYTHSPASDLRFVTTHLGKPSLVNPTPDIRFSVSHSGEQGMLAIALGREVGADIEIVRPDIEIDNLAGRFFSPHERQSLRSLPPEQKLAAFFRCWTGKEAFLKAQGVGLSRSLDSFDIDLNSARLQLLATRPDPRETEQWSLFEIPCVPGYAAAAATEGRLASIRVLRCS